MHIYDCCQAYVMSETMEVDKINNGRYADDQEVKNRAWEDLPVYRKYKGWSLAAETQRITSKRKRN